MSQVCYFLASVTFMALIWSRQANGCMRTGGGGGVVVTTTPAPQSECAAKQGEVPIYEDSSFVIASSFYGQVPSSSTCATCSTGQALYYPDSAEVVPRAASAKAIGGLNCANLCLCQADGTCFVRNTNNQNANVFLYPFCNGADCAVYAIVVGGTNTDGIVTTDGATTVTASSQVNPTTLDMFPVTQGNLYPRITSVSCNGCNFQMSCNGGPSP